MSRRRSSGDERWFATTRRSFLGAGLGLAAGSALPGCFLRSVRRDPWSEAKDAEDDPITRFPDGAAERRFFGDDPDRMHKLLWAKGEAIETRGGLPPIGPNEEKTRVLIVGAGLSGLTAAYQLRHLRPLVIEGAPRFGGNAKAQKWGDLTYGVGSAYFTNAETSEPHMRMLADLDLDRIWREDHPIHDSMYIEGTIYPQFWFGGSDPKRKDDFVAAWEYFKQVRESRFPDVPFEPDGDLDEKAYLELDERTFAEELTRSLGEKLHPHVADVVRQYCWSSFGADSSEISAASGLNFLASDLGGMFVLPGGNASISQALVNRLREDIGPGALRSRTLAIDVRRVPEGVRVLTVGPDDALHTILADVCIMAVPKFIAKKMIDDLPPKQVAAITAITYRSYIVASVLVEQPRDPNFHDLFCIAGRAPGDPRDELDKRPFTDVILATFAREGHPTRTVLNLYRGIPYDGARQELLMPESYEQVRSRMEGALPVVMKALGLDVRKVRDVRLTRWGHPMVVPRPGMNTSAQLPDARATYAERVFFAQQDNFALPSFESAFRAASDTTEAITKLLAP